MVRFPRALVERAQALALAEAGASSSLRDLSLVLDWALNSPRVVALRRSEAKELERLAATHSQLDRDRRGAGRAPPRRPRRLAAPILDRGNFRTPANGGSACHRFASTMRRMKRPLSLAAASIAALSLLALPASAESARVVRGSISSVTAGAIAVKGVSGIVTTCTVVKRSPDLAGYSSGNRVQMICVRLRAHGKLVLFKIRHLAAVPAPVASDDASTKFGGAIRRSPTTRSRSTTATAT